MFNSETTLLSRPSEDNLSNRPKPTSMQKQPLNVLLVEDFAGDALLTRLSLDGTKVRYKLRTVRNGNDVIPLLWNSRANSQNELPDVILLDLGLPGKDGFEILAELTNAPNFIRAIPIVIMTGQEHFQYLQKTYDLWIADYVQKPCNVKKMLEVFTRIRKDKPRY